MFANKFTKHLVAPKPNGPPGVPPRAWSSPAIRFWENHLKRPFPPVSVDAINVVAKWNPLLAGLDSENQMRTAEVLEFEATLLREMHGSYDGFGKYLISERDWFLPIREKNPTEFDESFSRVTQGDMVLGRLLKFYFPVIRLRCMRDPLTKIVEKIFDE